jgi:hypothetical protein
MRHGDDGPRRRYRNWRAQYQLQAIANPTTGSWVNLGTNITTNSSIAITTASSGTSQFYRAYVHW